jgi:AcrR family transcriptional regulator
MERDLKREDWLREARLALLRGGIGAVRVERLARSLHVTKGSFYWHFQDRDDLLESLLREWENEVAEILPQLGRAPANQRLQVLVRLLERRARLSEEGKVPSDAAIFVWASVDRRVAVRVNKADEERFRQLARLGRRDQMELFYLVWLGFVARGQRVPESRKRFPEIARTILRLFAAPPSKKQGSRQGATGHKKRPVGQTTLICGQSGQ